MAVTDVNGTQTAVIGTEHTLANSAAAGVYVLKVDLTNLVAGDILELRMKTIILTGGTPIGCFVGVFSDAQSVDELAALSPPIPTALADSGAVRATLKQVLGTGRAFKWEFIKVG